MIRFFFLKTACTFRVNIVSMSTCRLALIFQPYFPVHWQKKQAKPIMAWLYCATAQQFLYIVSFYNLRHDHDFCNKFFP